MLERILALGGENARIRRELADALAKDQRVDTACIHYGVLADNELQAHRTDGAVELFRRILALSPKHVKAHEQLASIYAKRGQKREAFVHYQALVETFREQNHIREARAAAIAALECDPTQAELRTTLIEFFLVDNLKEPAAQQLELQGDLAARAGNVKMAVDSYRRAMQLAPANKRLKKKLQDVMLTKEDRLARKRRIATMCAVGGVLVLLTAALFIKEHLNEKAFATAKRAAATYAAQGDELGRNEKYGEAKEQYESAARQYGAVTRLWSPVVGVQEKAKSEIGRFTTLAREAEEKARKQQDDNVRTSNSDLEAAESAFKGKRLKDACDLYAKVLQNADSPPQNRLTAEKKLRDAQKLIDGLEKALRRLKGDPLREFASVEDERAEKQRLVDEYTGFPGFNVADIEMPLLIQPDTDGVQVFLDNRPVGTANPVGGREANTFRYPAAGAHRFDFKKPGFKTITQNTASLRSAALQLKLEREPVVRMDLRAYLGPDVTLCGEPAWDGDLLYVGTSDGGILQVRLGDPPAVRAYKLAGGGGLHKEVYGPIFVYKRPGKEDYIVYCTLAGDCIGIKAVGAGFKDAWTPLKGGATPLNAPPSVFKLNFMSNPIFAMPAEKRLIMVDCEKGVQAAGSPVDFKATLTSSPAGVDQEALIVVGVKDGQTAKLRGLVLRDRSFRDWLPGLDVGALRGEPAVYEDDIVLGADDGNFYLFRPSRPGDAPIRITMERAGAIVCEPLIVKKRAYVGTIEREGFWCADLVRHEPQWTQSLPDMGGVRHKAAVLDNTVYFGTDKGRLYALDTERGRVRWVYTVEGGSRFVGPPLVNGRRVYVVNAEGAILGFDE
ncbi:MAG: PQQ-binding-like beta-propeller repeat protein [Planctomycetota bacterium]|nr:PQQ-binding-like beta-propeller repeat protein [Planctomycetota bacterium]